MPEILNLGHLPDGATPPVSIAPGPQVAVTVTAGKIVYVAADRGRCVAYSGGETFIIDRANADKLAAAGLATIG